MDLSNLKNESDLETEGLTVSVIGFVWAQLQTVREQNRITIYKKRSFKIVIYCNNLRSCLCHQKPHNYCI